MFKLLNVEIKNGGNVYQRILHNLFMKSLKFE